MEKDIKPAEVEKISDDNLESTNVVDSVAPPPTLKEPKNKKKLLIISLILLAITSIMVGAWLITRPESKPAEQTLKITIGDITITQADIDRYAKSVENYKKANPNVVLEGEAYDIATDDLIMNAALIKEAKDKKKSLTEAEVKKGFGISGDSDDYQSYLNSLKTKETPEYYNLITKENILLRRKLEQSLIGERSLFYISANFDAPFFRSQKSEADVAKLHEQAKTKLEDVFLPMFEQNASQSEIIKKADIDYTSDKTSNSNPEPFYKKIVYTADYINKYQDSVEDSGFLDPKAITSSEDIPQTFKDLEDVDYGTKVDNLVSTIDEINKLEKVGDHTKVFASKSGAYMIVRLDKKQGGEYDNWKAFLNKYKQEYIPKTSQNASASSVYKKTASNLLHKAMSWQLPWEETASAVVCSNHRISVEIQMIDTDTWAQVNGPVSISQAAGQCPGGSASGSGYASFTGNCYNSQPNWSSTVPSGYSRVGAVPDAWTPANVNSRGNFRVFIHVRRNQTTISANSTLLKDTGPQFGPEASISGHAVALANPISYYSQNQSYISTSWTVNSGSQNTINATAPSTVTEGNGNVWQLAAGVPSQKTRSNVTNNETATFNFTYTRSTTPPPTPNPPPPPPTPTPTPTPTPPPPPTPNPPPPPPPAEPTDSPYLRVFGNDVITGSRFPDSTGSCLPISATDDTTIRATTRTASNQWYGASSEFAVFDYGDVDQFFSNSPSTTASANPPLDLTFGNYGTKSDGTVGRITGATNYGGNSGLAPCLPDYYQDAVNKGTTPTVLPANKEFNGGTAMTIPNNDPSNTNRRIYVIDGDVYIRNNITYQNETWNSVEEIPNFYLIVKGNISIAPNVTRLDGIYVAQPNPAVIGDTGQIYTCASSLNTRVTTSNLVSQCNTKLTINGSFIAKKSYFGRAIGRLNSPSALPASDELAGSTNIAEVFNFSPEAYLTPLNSSLKTTLPYENYDYIVSLPPVL